MANNRTSTLFGKPSDFDQAWKLAEQILQHCFDAEVALSIPRSYDANIFNLNTSASLSQVLTLVKDEIVSRSINARHPWAIGHMLPPPSTISVLADLVVGATNQCAFIWEEAPLAKTIETEVVKWLSSRLSLGSDSIGILTSGGTMSNFMAIFAALQKYRKINKTQNPKIICSDQAHFSIEKSAILLGLGVESVIRIPTDMEGRVSLEAIQEITENTLTNEDVFILVCTAGTTNAGTIEPYDNYKIVAQKYGIWLHVDAAFGGMAKLQSNPDSRVRNWRNADSISWDPHKSLYVTYSVGALFFKTLAQSPNLNITSDYALKRNQSEDVGRNRFEGSSRFEALKVWMTIKCIGVEGYQNITDLTMTLAREFSSMIENDDNFQLVTVPDLNIVCFRLLKPDSTHSEVDLIHESTKEILYRSGGPLISTTKINSLVVFRLVFMNPNLKHSELRNIKKEIFKAFTNAGSKKIRKQQRAG